MKEVTLTIDGAPKPLYRLIIDAVCLFYDISQAELFLKKRTHIFSERRAMLYYLIDTLTDMSRADLSEALGISRTSIIKGVERIEAAVCVYVQVSDKVRKIAKIVRTLEQKQEAWPIQTTN